MEDGSQKLTSFQTIEKSQKTKLQLHGPHSEVSQVISDPQMAKTAQPVKDQPSSSLPPKGSRFNPIYVEPGSTSIDSTRDLQVLFPNTFDCIGDMLGEYDIKTDPTVPPVQHGRCKVPIEYKEEIEKELGEMVHQGNHHQTDWAHIMGQLSHLPKEGRMASWGYASTQRTWTKPSSVSSHKAPTLEEIAHILTGVTNSQK